MNSLATARACFRSILFHRTHLRNFSQSATLLMSEDEKLKEALRQKRIVTDEIYEPDPAAASGKTTVRILNKEEIAGVQDISPESLSLFTILEPKIDILVLGVGEPENMERVNKQIITYLRSKRISVEILPTEQALSTFNFLNSEARRVGGAFIPPTYMTDVDETIAHDDFLMTHDDQDLVEAGDAFFPDKKASMKVTSGEGKEKK